MLTRQKIALQFVKLAGGGIDKLRLVKLLFLFSDKTGSVKSSGTFYQFLPYKRGPFSFALYHELNTLYHYGIVSATETEFSLDEKALKIMHDLGPSITSEVNEIWRLYGGLNTGQLVDFVYQKYPWYTVKSEWVDRRRMPLPNAEEMVYTIGYEGMQIDGFIDLLLKVGIKAIIDVRANPVSRKYGFHKSTLARISKDADIEYSHYPQVGIPASWRAKLTADNDYRELFDRYESEILADEGEAIGDIANRMSTMPSVLVCQERDPYYCHRTRLAQAIGRKNGLPVGDLRHLSNDW